MIIRKDFSPTGHRIVESGGLIFISGSTASDRSEDMTGQTAQILKKLSGFLESAETDRSKVLFATVYLTDMDRKPEMDVAWSAYFKPDQLPARATVGVADLGKDCLVEIAFTATR